MPKVKKNGKLPKPKAKPKPKAEREDNIKSSSTKSKSVNQHQNVNVSVSIVKNKTGGSSKSGEANQSNTSGSNQIIKPKPQPQNVYYQQPNNNNSYNSELTTLLKDMNKKLYAQRDIKALNQPLLNPFPLFQTNKPLFGNPKPLSYVGGSVFDDEPFEEHNSDLASVTTDSNITSAKIIPDTNSEVPDIPTVREKPSSSAQKLLIPIASPINSLSNDPNPFEGRKLFDSFEMPLTPSEIPVEAEQEPVVTARKKKPPIQTTLPFTTPKKIVVDGEDTQTFAEREVPVRQVSAPNNITSVFESKGQFKNSNREEKVNEIKRLEEEYGIDLKYSPDMKASEIYNILAPYVKDGRKKN